MSLFIRQNDERSKLQERLAAELQERAKQRALLQDQPDGVDDSRYIEGTKRTTSLAWVWVVIAIVVVVAFVGLVILNVARTA